MRGMVLRYGYGTQVCFLRIPPMIQNGPSYNFNRRSASNKIGQRAKKIGLKIEEPIRKPSQIIKFIIQFVWKSATE